MKVKTTDSLEYKLTQKIEALPDDVFLRAEVDNLAPPRQLSRALSALVSKQKIARLGYGVYAKLRFSSYLPGQPILKAYGFNYAVRMALTKLGIPWDLSEEEKAYNKKESEQVPVKPPIVLLRKTRRHFSFSKMEARFEYH